MKSTEKDPQDQVAEAPAPQLYTATLKQGQSYAYNGKTFEYNDPVVVTAEEYSYLRRNAVKSTLLGAEDGDQARLDIPYFIYAKVSAIVAKKDTRAPIELLDDDDLDTVTITEADATGNSALGEIREDALDETGGASAPGARSRARRNQG